METATHLIKAGDTVRITAGAHAERLGKVRSIAATGTLHVEFQAPVLLTQPDGPTKSVTLPFAPREVVPATDLIPAASGRHRRLTLPHPVDFDHGTKAVHMPACGGMGSGMCPRCTPGDYARRYAEHRAVTP